MSYWTPSDDLYLSRVQNGLAQVQQDLDLGELDPIDGGPLVEELEGKRQALESRQQQAEVVARGRERLKIQDEMAFQTATNLRNQQLAANEFATVMPRVQTPDMDEAMYFIPNGKGSFEPLERQQPELPDVNDMTAAVEDRAGPPEPPPAPVAPRPGPPPPMGAIPQTITNGAETTNVYRDAAGRVIGFDGSPNGLRGVLEGAGRNFANVDGQVAAEAWNRANAAIPGEMSAARFQRVQEEFKRQLPAVEQERGDIRASRMYGLSIQQVQVARDQALATLSGAPNRVVNREFPRVFNQILRTLAGNQRQHSAQLQKQQMEEQRQQRAAAARYEIEYRKHFDAIQKEITAKRKELAQGEKGDEEMGIQKFARDPKNAGKSYLWDRDAHIAEARSRAQAATQEKYPEFGQQQRGGAPGGAQGGPTPEQQQQAFAELMNKLMAPPAPRPRPAPEPKPMDFSGVRRAGVK